MNRTIEMYLGCFVGDKPKTWIDWLPCVEYCNRTSFHTTLHTSFQVVYERAEPRLLSYIPGSSRVEVVDQALMKRDEVLADI